MSNDYLLAIDPSLRSSGVALFLNEKLVAADFLKTPTKLKRYDAMLYQKRKVSGFMADCNGFRTMNCVVEEQTRRGDNEKMSMDDFVRLAALSYFIVPGYLIDYLTFVKPSTWKGTTPKPIKTQRIYENEIKLGTSFELVADMQSDKLDAIGIGRWYYTNRKGSNNAI